MMNIPREKALDSSLSLLVEGYEFASKRCERLQSDIFQTRLLGEEAVFLHGAEGAGIFYDTQKFKREGAIPAFIKKSLFGEGSVQSMDNEAHRNRKEVFMSLMSPENMQKLMALTEGYWQQYIRKWEQTNGLVVLFEEVQEILCRAACEWVGIPLKEKEVRIRTDDFIGRIDSFGSAGPRYLRGFFARQRVDNWVQKVIEQVRNGELEAKEGTAVHSFANFKEPDGMGGEPKLLDAHTAAVEVINVVRPFIAVAYYVTFSALALHEHPEYKEKLQKRNDEDIEMFVQEVRRLYPFVPVLGARVREDFDWKGYSFEKGKLVILDVYGTLHDPRLWEAPYEFRPARFLNWKGSAFDLIPQGGGDHHTGHRCAGEWITIGALKVALNYLLSIQYEVPRQNLNFSLKRIPAYPKSGFTIRYVKKKEDSTSSVPGAGRFAASAGVLPVVDRGGCPYHIEKDSSVR